MKGPDPRHDPVELGALALGLLSPEQARAVQRHLTGCAMCRREYEELTEMTGMLGELPPEAFLDGPPDGDLVLQRTLRQIRAETSAQRRRRLLSVVAAAAVVVAAIAGGGVAIGRASVPLVPPPGSAVGAVMLAGSGPGGATMRATLGPAASWVRLTASVAGIPAGERCRIMVVARDGSEEVAGSWVVSGAPAGVTLEGSAAVALSDVAAVSVQNEDGKEFVRAVV
ncbi:MAG TPA: zf-HC2 domain-containing protein [Pseudonocardia sp.]